MKSLKKFTPQLNCWKLLFVFLNYQILFTEAIPPSHVDLSYCKPYKPDPIDRAAHIDERGRPLLFMGETWDKRYWMTTANFTGNFFRGNFNLCARMDLTPASVQTACEYGIIRRWFFDHPVKYNAWLGGFRMADLGRPYWILTGEPIDFSEFGEDIDFIQGPYPPSGYSPVLYYWDNCLSVNRLCPEFTNGPTLQCEETEEYPELQFMWNDCKKVTRVICEETI